MVVFSVFGGTGTTLQLCWQGFVGRICCQVEDSWIVMTAAAHYEHTDCENIRNIRDLGHRKGLLRRMIIVSIGDFLLGDARPLQMQQQRQTETSTIVMTAVAVVIVLVMNQSQQY